MIEINNLSKTFKTKNSAVDALKDVSLDVEKGQIYGVIGYSGAGKSTLIRCVNLLEKPTTGTISIDGMDLTSLSPGDLLTARRRIGMIFQGFNLLKTATVYDNIAIPLKLTGVSKSDIKTRVNRYLDIVDLQDKADSFPAELSGGQKQRVAIARALSHEPEVLLSDEATSALDPDTTEAILDLLLKINDELGITILLITHEMHVIQRICDNVAVMDDGRIVEKGKTIDVFTAPKETTTKKFVNSLFDYQPLIESHDALEKGTTFLLKFMGSSSQDPALAVVTKKFDLYPNILYGNITQLKDEPFGQLLVHFDGDKNQVNHAIDYLQAQDIQVEEVSQHADHQ